MNFINPIYYNEQGIIEINNFIRNYQPSKIIFLVDENTHEFCFPIVLSNLEIEVETEILEIESGEENKNLHTCISLWEALTEFKIDRKALLINIGGGVLTDMGGFVAQCYKRGIKFINIPTTLLAMVDASIGGKTGVDLWSHKNQVGTFSLPEMVIVNPEFISTLSQKQILSGFAEIIKHGLIADENYWKEIISLPEIKIENLERLIKTSIEIKKQVVSEDFTELGLRKILNFGHTIGHAVESYFLEKKEPILHGEGVALGIITESYISVQKGLLPNDQFMQIEKYINTLYPKLELKEEYFEEILIYMQNDKKNTNNEVKFVLLEKIGKAVFDEVVEKELVERALQYYISH